MARNGFSRSVGSINAGSVYEQRMKEDGVAGLHLDIGFVHGW